MNIFLLVPDYVESGRIFKAKDPIRFNKQIVECAQLLAFFEIWHNGSSTLLRADGQPYQATKSQLNHPLTLHMKYHRSTYDLCWNVLQGLLANAPGHQCKYSLARYESKRMWARSTNQEWIVVRRDHPIRHVQSLTEYCQLITHYLEHFKWKAKP